MRSTPPFHRRHRLTSLLLALLLLTLPAAFAATDAELQQALSGLAAKNRNDIKKAIIALGELGDARALPALVALKERQLQANAEGQLFIEAEDGSLTDPLTGQPTSSASKLSAPRINNSVRRKLTPVIAQLQLGAPDVEVRRAAAMTVSQSPDPELAPILRQRLQAEEDAEVREQLKLALAQIDLASDDPATRIAALQEIEAAGRLSLRSMVQPLVAKDDAGNWRETDAGVRIAAQNALNAIERQQTLVNWGGNLFYGLSLGSVLLLAALGLAITFGLMGIINMAHGEMLMLGAYTTYVTQNLFLQYLPGAFNGYLLVAIPLAFLVTALIGVLLERLVIRHLYARPLESLLATWGISLALIQTVRLTFGAQNVAVANPDWLSGGFEVVEGLVLTWNRVATIAFAFMVLAGVWMIFRHTRLGLQLRAVTQNREMASAMGIRTQRVDMWTFALGSGVAGLGGVALSQLGNVGPELGQGYIVDSFMVVVLGGVGELAGAVAGAFTLGLVGKFLEPSVGAVFGKVLVLIFVILFIQRRPQGMFALKGRAAEG